MSLPPEISAIITGHHEGRVAVASLRSFWEAVDHARGAGLAVETHFVLDRPNALTAEVFAEHTRGEAAVHTCDFGDQGRARNLAIAAAGGRYTAFLDADDLWARDWLCDAHAFLEAQPARTVAHPEYNYFFEQQAMIFRQPDQDDATFSLDLLRVANLWDALFMAPTALHREFAFTTRDIEKGWAFEDWHWNCETIAAGVRHKVVPDTVIFKRRQRRSQTVIAAQTRSRVRVNALSRYGAAAYGSARAEPSG